MSLNRISILLIIVLLTGCFICACGKENSEFHVENTEILSIIASDSAHAANDIQGKTVFDLPKDSPVMAGAKEALQKLDLL